MLKLWQCQRCLHQFTDESEMDAHRAASSCVQVVYEFYTATKEISMSTYRRRRGLWSEQEGDEERTACALNVCV